MTTANSFGNPPFRTFALHAPVELGSADALPTEFGNFRIVAHTIPPSVHHRSHIGTRASRGGHIIDVTAPSSVLPTQPEAPLAGA